MTVSRLAVIGDPVSHSRSPMVHRHWIARHGLDATYDPVRVAPVDLTGFAEAVRGGVWRGCNVTVPHKEAALALADAPDEAARAVGGANTLWAEGGALHATTTDGPGFIAGLGSSANGVERALVLGAGGAARAIVQALRARGVSVVIANRTRARAETLAQGFGAQTADWDAMIDAARHADLLVNATSLGMTGQAPLTIAEPVIDALPGDAIVADIVYAPLETPLLAAARARGLHGVDGLGMLLHQAALSFEIWFGTRPEVSPELRALVEADLVEADPVEADPVEADPVEADPDEAGSTG